MESPLSGLIGFTFQFESQKNHICWENLYFSIRAVTSNLNCDMSLKVHPTIEFLHIVVKKKIIIITSSGPAVNSRESVREKLNEKLHVTVVVL